MFRNILKYGVIAGLVVGGVNLAMFVSLAGQPHIEHGMLIGYTTMLVALSAIFFGIKRQRDQELGGVIRFWPAFGMGLAISLLAGVFYVSAWELSQAITGGDFATTYGTYLIDQARAKGESAAAIAKISAEMAQFKIQYANPWFRLPMVFAEIFPVGVLVSLVSAGLLRNPRFLSARPALA
jgi:hypothetical protein